MKLSTFAIIITVLAGAFGLAFIFIPQQVSSFYGLDTCPSGLWMSRYWGGALLFIAMIYWSYSSVSPSAKSWPKLLIFSAVYHVIQLVLTLMSILSGLGNTYAWSIIGLYVLLFIGDVYFLGVCKKARAQS